MAARTKKHYISCWNEHVNELNKLKSERITAQQRDELTDAQDAIKRIIKIAADNSKKLK